MSNSDWAAYLTAAFTLAGVVVVFFQLRGVSAQIRLQNFSDYTKRYQEVILRFPEDVNQLDFVLKDRQDYAQTMRTMRAYFDLCYEEWYLDSRKLIDRNFWSVWKGGIETALTKPAFQQAWQIIKTDTSFGKDFETFINERIHSS